MTIILSTHEDMLDCITALGNARRAYTIVCNAQGEFEITTKE